MGARHDTSVWSSTKTMLALSALVLADRGELDVYAPVARYWPEFAANGKESIEVRHLLSHTSGVSGWAQPVVVDDIFDWEKSTSMLAAQAPWWEPGTASGYYALNQGHLVGEVIRRITGLKLGEFFDKEIAQAVGCRLPHRPRSGRVPSRVQCRAAAGPADEPDGAGLVGDTRGFDLVVAATAAVA